MNAPESTWAATGSPGPGCEPDQGGLLDEPVSAVTSLALVLAGVVILAAGRHRSRQPGHADGAGPPRPPSGLGRVAYALLVVGTGVGSVIQHGPDPAWSDLAHDLPLLATLAFVAADGAADLSGRPGAWWWWAAPSLALVPLVLAAPEVADAVQVGIAVLAVGLTLLRARARPALRQRILMALALLGIGGLLGSLSRAGGPLCVPDSLWQGHAAWHVLAAVALVVLAPVVTRDPAPTGSVPRPHPA